MQGTFNTDVRFRNSTTPTLCAAPWPLLLSRLGDTLMLYLLLHACIFVPLPNCCYLQVAGSSVAKARSSLITECDEQESVPWRVWVCKQHFDAACSCFCTATLFHAGSSMTTLAAVPLEAAYVYIPRS